MLDHALHGSRAVSALKSLNVLLTVKLQMLLI